MGKIAFIFSGQGAQYGGMGWELYGASSAAKAVFDTADGIRPGTSGQCFEGTAETLSQTENTQPCLFCVDLAAAAALREAGVTPDMLAGFSLGELAALAFSGAVTYEDAFKLVCRRAYHMAGASRETPAAMAAVLKLDDDTVIALTKEFENVYAVNFNSPGQVVVSGEVGALEAFKARVKEKGGKTMPLKVSGGFHSPFMASASDRFAEELEDFTITPPSVPLYSNVTARPYEDDFKGLLALQIKSPVQWWRTVENMIAAGADTFVEVGPGKVLSGLVSRISDKARVFNVEDVSSLKNTVSEVQSHA
ncbi:[acyl-carrier-protein] S-malonyltransferase [Sporobacter termitidis DSM 10068]|uniref:Malonyl CoA-acyl carrier protein transacylase n=1 Tax=Sporobacter termitidis DSM 10068 TaxID=1123282 RepID=A0A1M5X277_9FIRM|nr:ACP S-malonyltransferase [Sporobacter termitidis]SHH93975.1 [acyl-carrier-protein] S-malonyltransferase [Sporobacter termitidis DSM 10068]